MVHTLFVKALQEKLMVLFQEAICNFERLEHDMTILPREQTRKKADIQEKKTKHN
jgi:hypothetical protein